MFLDFSYDKSDVINALRFHFMNRGEIRVFRVTLLILFGFTVIGNLLGLVPFPTVLGVFVLIFVLIMVFWYILPISTFQKSATFRENIHLNYDEQEIKIGTRTGERRLVWKSFFAVVETRDFFFLYRDRSSFFLIPTGAFADEQSRKEFRRFLQGRFSRYKLGKGT